MKWNILKDISGPVEEFLNFSIQKFYVTGVPKIATYKVQKTYSVNKDKCVCGYVFTYNLMSKHSRQIF